MSEATPTSTIEPILPAYGQGSIADVVPAIINRGLAEDSGSQANLSPRWIPAPVHAARQVVLLVIDGLGWQQLRDRPHLAPTLCAAVGMANPITSVAPTTTAAALTSITTGTPPAQHGILGYRLAEGDQIMNMLRWTLGPGAGIDARNILRVADYQPQAPFQGASPPVPVVSKVDFGGTGFTAAHLGDAPLYDYRVQSSLAVEVRRALGSGAPLVYAYYDGIDRVAHAHGFGDHYDAELRSVDRMVSDVAALLPSDAVLVVTADHGQIDVGSAVEVLGREPMAMIRFLSGEGRFRWLHAHHGADADLLDVVQERYGASSWIRSRLQAIDEGWFGAGMTKEHEARLGDVVLAPHQPIAFADPADTGENRLCCRHGSLTADEMLVPLLAIGGDNL